MKSSFKKLPGSKIELEVSLTKEEFLPYYNTANEAALKNVHLKGFRPGTAPKEMADAAVDKDVVFNEAAKNVVRWSLDEISKDNEWTLIDAPHVEIQDAKDLGISYKATLTIFPEIKLANYKKIAKKVMAEEKIQVVEPKELEQTLEWIRGQRKPVGAPTEASEEKLPELNDEFAKSLGKFENLDALKKSVTEGILAEKNVREHDRLRLKMLDEIVKESAVDLPEVMVQKTYDSMIRQYAAMLKASGPLRQGSSEASKKEEDAQKEVYEKAKNNVLNNLVIYKLAQTEKLEPTEEEVKQREGSVESDQNYQYIYGVLQNEKVFKFLEAQK